MRLTARFSSLARLSRSWRRCNLPPYIFCTHGGVWDPGFFCMLVHCTDVLSVHDSGNAKEDVSERTGVCVATTLSFPR